MTAAIPLLFPGSRARPRKQWLMSHTSAHLWMAPSGGGSASAIVPQWSVFEQIEPQQGSRIRVNYFGNSSVPAGEVWVDAGAVGPIDEPAGPPVEPDWATDLVVDAWLRARTEVELQSGPARQAETFARVPRGSIFKQAGPEQNGFMLVEYFGNRVFPAGMFWVSVAGLVRIDEPATLPPVEPEWRGGDDLRGGRWLMSHAVTELWSNPYDDAIAFTMVPQWSIFQQVGEQVGGRILVHYFGNSAADEGVVWVNAEALGPIDEPTELPPTEPEWPAPTRSGFSPAAIATIVGCGAADAEKGWAAIVKALEEQGIADRPTFIAAIATTAVETAYTFRPIHEYGGDAYFTRSYEGRTDLGNTKPGDGARFHGRGFIQITGRANYRAYGKLLKEQLEKEPDRALDPEVAARVMAVYFKDRDIPGCAARGDWRAVRKRVQGGYAGWENFIRIVKALESIGASEPEVSGNATVDDMLTYARTLLGIPYEINWPGYPRQPGRGFGKRCPPDGGIDCSGFVLQVMQRGNILMDLDPLFSSVETIRARCAPIADESDVRPGDLAFFQTYAPGATHIGIVTRPRGVEMINAREPVVSIDAMSDNWRRRLLGFGRPPGL
jgi:hypothetical protein